MGELIWIGRILPNTVYNKFQKQPLWLANKRIELYEIRIDAGDIAPTIHHYENIAGISGSGTVYRLYFDNTHQVYIHIQLVHGKI